MQTVIATADGSCGTRGFVTDALPEQFDTVCACGPMPMLKALCAKTDKPGQISLEARMGCGFGACMGCTIDTVNGPKRVCREGPVFGRRDQMVKTNVTLCSLSLDNPVIPASGTFGYGHEFAELYDINCLGTFSFKERRASRVSAIPSRASLRCKAVCLTPWVFRTPAWTRLSPRSFPSSRAFSASPSWQMSAAFRSMNMSRSAKA